MLEWLKLWWMFAPTDFWWFKANSVFSKATSKATPNMSVVERSATPKTDILASQSISTQANPSGIVNSFAKTSTMLERQIEDSKKKVVMPNINQSMWFGWFAWITKPLQWLPESTAVKNWSAEDKWKLNAEIKPTQAPIQSDTITSEQLAQPVENEELKQPLLDLWVTIQADKYSPDELQSKFPEFANLDKQVFLDLWATIQANPDMWPEEIMQKFPELWGVQIPASDASMAWWVKWWISRMWGNRGQAEWINPIWKSFEDIDNQIQKIGVVDFTKPREDALNQRIKNLSSWEIQKYQTEREAYKKNNPKLSNLFSKTVEWDNLVSKMRNIVTWDTQDRSEIDAFKDFVKEREKWFVDQLVGVGTEWPKFANMMANIPWSALKTISAVARWLTNPVDTMTWLYKLVATPEGRQALWERYGSREAFANSMEKDPIWVASDVLTIVEWWANLVKLWAKAAWATKLAAKAWDVANVAWSASDLWVRNVLPAGLNKLGEVSAKLQEWTPMMKTLGKFWELAVATQHPLDSFVSVAKSIWENFPTAEWTIQRMNRLTKGNQEKFVKTTGQNVGKWLNDNVWPKTPSETVEVLWERIKDNMNQVDTAVEVIKWWQKYKSVSYETKDWDIVTYKSDAVKDMADDAIGYAERTGDPRVDVIKDIADKYDRWEASMTDINKLQRYYQANTRMWYFKDMTAWEKTVRSTNIDSAVREWKMKVWEENGFTNFRQINKDTQASKMIMDALAKNEAGKLGNNAVSLTDWIVASPAMIEPTLLAWLVTKKVLQSNWFTKNYAKILNRLNWHEIKSQKVADMITISKIQDEKAFQSRLDEWKLNNQVLPLKQWVGETIRTNILPDKKAIPLSDKSKLNDTSNTSSNSNIDNLKTKWEAPVELLSNLWKTVKQPNVYSKGLGAKSKK